VVDNHSSEAGWCCEPSAPDGVWFTDHYPEARWVEALAGMARRYRGNPHVVAVELRNEVRDTPGVQAVWGSGDASGGKALADWPTAAELAGNAVLAEDPSLLVLVTGLCFGQDLRGAAERPLQLALPGRLVWTSHSYHWFFWWHSSYFRDKCDRLGFVALGLAVLSALSAICVAVRARRTGRNRTTPRACFETSCGFIGLLGAVFVVYSTVKKSEEAACADKAQRDKGPFLVWGGVLLACGLSGLVLAALLRHRDCQRRAVLAAVRQREAADTVQKGASLREHLLPLLVWLALSLGAIALFFVSASGYWLLADHLDRHWGFVLEEGQPYTAPVVLGEFGTSRSDDFWRALVRYVAERDLDFAYWPLNGQKWNHDEGKLVEETYGLLDSSWTGVRHDWKLRDVIGYDAAAGR